MRLSVNLAAPTIEQVLAKRKKVVTDMCVHMSESLERELKGKAWDVLTDLLSSDGDDGVSGDGVDVIVRLGDVGQDVAALILGDCAS